MDLKKSKTDTIDNDLLLYSVRIPYRKNNTSLEANYRSIFHHIQVN